MYSLNAFRWKYTERIRAATIIIIIDKSSDYFHN